MKKTIIRFTKLKLTSLVFFASLILTASAQAAVYTVTKTADTSDGVCNADCSLREAIAAANATADNDVIEFDASVFGTPQTITLTGGRILINNNGTLTINGTGANQLIVSGNNTSRAFSVNAGATATLNALTIANGIGSTGFSGGNNGLGGGIYNLGNLTVNNATIRNNTAVNGGGGIRSDSGSTIILNNSTVSNNSSSKGGGIDTNGNVSLTLTNSTISGNTASVASGGFANTGTLIANNSTISNNSSNGGGGGFINFGTASLNNSTINNNSATNEGGGFYNAGTASVTNSVIRDNIANNGAGAANSGSGGTLTLTNSTVRGNSTVNGNAATNAGGGLYNIFGGTLTVNSSTVSGNSTTNTGAGIYNRSALTLNNTTVSGNTGANWGGGGVRVEGGGTATVNSSTISNNSSANFGGGISVVDAGSIATLNNTIIADSPAGGDSFNSGATINASYSLIEGGLTYVNGTNSNNKTGDPNLGPLQNNGGETFTHALLNESIAIDAGNSALTTDQRGLTRPVDNSAITDAMGGNGSDIGSFETQNFAPTANNDAFSGDEDTLLAGNVLTNDSNGGAGTLSAALVTQSANGTVMFNADGSFTYQPNQDFNGTDSFTYKANNGSYDSNEATATITVNAVNDAPSITAASGVSRQQAAGSSRSQIATVSDADNEAGNLSVTAALTSGSGVSISNIAIDANGNVTADVAAGCGATNSTFNLTVSDGSASAAATLNVAVTNETTPPVIDPISNVTVYLPAGSTANSMVVNFALPTALDNCGTVTVTTNPASGSVFPVGTTTVTATATDQNGNQSTATFTVSVLYRFGGFLSPVNNTGLNKATAGSSIPVKFSLSGYKGTAVIASAVSFQIPCSGTGENGEEIPTTTAGNSGLNYDASSDTYNYVWKTDKTWKDTCRRLLIVLSDGTSHTADFQFK